MRKQGDKFMLEVEYKMGDLVEVNFYQEGWKVGIVSNVVINSKLPENLRRQMKYHNDYFNGLYKYGAGLGILDKIYVTSYDKKKNTRYKWNWIEIIVFGEKRTYIFDDAAGCRALYGLRHLEKN